MESKRAKRPKRKDLSGGLWLGRSAGFWCATIVGLLLVLYAGMLFASRPVVDGDRLRVDGFFSLADGNRIRSVEILDEDGFIVGRYVRGDGAVARYNVPYFKSETQRDRLVQLLIDNKIPSRINQQFAKSLITPSPSCCRR